MLDPTGFVTPDLAGKLPGRGAWVKASREAIVAAAARGLIARALKAEARLPEGVTPEGFALVVERLLEQRALDALGLARRAGGAVVGFEKARSALKGGAVAVLVTARDASADGAAKLARMAASAPVVDVFTSAALSQALGRERVMHVALSAGPEAARFLRETARLSGFRGVSKDVREPADAVD